MGAAILAGVIRARRHPSEFSYGLGRLVLKLPRPFVDRDRLRLLLDPRPGERLLEVGPGTGYYTLDVAGLLKPGGTLHALDVQQRMLDHTLRAARERGIDNIVAGCGDARSLPYGDDTFDGAYMVAVLGEVPDQEAVLQELHRVLKPGGRLVIGESLPDPHMVPPDALRRRAEGAGLRFERQLGGRGAYLARFTAR
ncbi:class I SAM-dependent methyltransferase [Rubrobacter calidifluminis]|uniref:class I SAM-dependent methyltransferase n=1 Tax=Rubrobacter calidifluminis TaxID=1392640 RepID=UPI0023602A09|nr:methyltransferase domain-containing protein [Rubrobacter calidifluminis]